jgi:lysophospholipase L1-like esterase
MPIETTKANLASIIRRIQGQGAMVVLLGFEFPSFGPDYGDLYEDVAEEQRCLLVPDLLDGILSNPKLKSDEIHPNAAGYALIAERVSGPLAKLIDRANAR